MTGQSSARRTRLTPEREQEVFEAVLELVREHGYDAVTIDAIVTGTRLSKATLYRQWESKATLVVTALRHAKRLPVADIDTGSLAGDLHDMVQMIGERSSEFTALMQSMAHAVLQDPELDRAFREILIDPERAAVEAMIRRAIERGEVAADNPVVEFVPHMLVGAFTAHPMIESGPATTEYLTRYLQTVVVPALKLE